MSGSPATTSDSPELAHSDALAGLSMSGSRNAFESPPEAPPPAASLPPAREPRGLYSLLKTDSYHSA
ncbi:MAG: hypothetical protein ABW321_24665 [Polyangiales bacterium]